MELYPPAREHGIMRCSPRTARNCTARPEALLIGQSRDAEICGCCGTGMQSAMIILSSRARDAGAITFVQAESGRRSMRQI